MKKPHTLHKRFRLRRPIGYVSVLLKLRNPQNTPKFSEAQGFELRRRVLTLLAGPGQQAVEARGLLRCRGILSSRVMPGLSPRSDTIGA